MGRVNLRPDSFAEGGGLIDDFDGTITDARFTNYDYEGKVVEAVPVCMIHFDVGGEDAREVYPVGGENDFQPTEDGMGLDYLRTNSKLTKKCKCGRLLLSLIETGFPLNKMDNEDISYLVGLNGHFVREVMDLTGLPKKGDREKTVLLCTKINKLPWESGKSGKGKSGKAAKVDEGPADTVAGIIQGVLIENDGEMAKKSLLSALFKNDDIGALDDKKAALKLASNDTFLKGRDEWAFENGVLKMG